MQSEVNGLPLPLGQLQKTPCWVSRMHVHCYDTGCISACDYDCEDSSPLGHENMSAFK